MSNYLNKFKKSFSFIISYYTIYIHIIYTSLHKICFEIMKSDMYDKMFVFLNKFKSKVTF